MATAAAVLLRLFHLGDQTLWADEFLTWKSAHIGTRLPWLDVLQNDHGPLVQALLHAWGTIAGESEVALRLPAALATVAMVPLFAALAGRLLGPASRVPAAWIVALAPFLVWYGQEARNYAFVMLFATAAAWAAVRWHERRRTRDGALFVLFGWLAMRSNLNAAFVLPVLLAWIALPHGRRGGMLRPALLAAAALVVLELPWAIEFADRYPMSRLVPGREIPVAEEMLRDETTFSWGAYPFTFWVFTVGYTLGPSLYELHEGSPWRAALAHWPALLAVVVVFGGLALAGAWSLRRRPAVLFFAGALVLVPLACVTYLSLHNFKPFNPRYVSSGIAGYLLFLVAGWTSLGTRARYAAAAAVIVLWGWALGNLYFVPRYGKENYRGATQYVAAHITADDQLIGAGNSGLLDYYWRDRKPEYRHYKLTHVADPGRMRRAFAALRDPSREAFVIVSRPYLFDRDRRFERYLVDELGAKRTHFQDAEVYRLPARAPAPAR